MVSLLAISGFLVFGSSLFSAIFVLAYGYKKPVNLSWAVFSILVAFWGGGFGLTVIAKTAEAALLYGRFHNFVAIFIPVFFVLFTFIFLDIKKKLTLSLCFLLTITYFCVSLFNLNLFIPSVSIKLYHLFYINPGTLYFPFPVLYTLCVLIGLLESSKTLNKLPEPRNTQLKIIFWGFIFGFSGGGTTFPLVFGMPIYPFGTWGVVFYVLASAYAITKHDLMDIKLAITKTGAFLITLFVFATGYLGVIVLPYFLLTSNKIDIPFLVISILYGGLGVGLYFHRIQQFFQTTAYKKFLDFKYNLEDTLKAASSKLVRAQDTQDVLDAIFTIQSSLEIGDSYAILREDTGEFTWYLLNKIKADYIQDESVAKQLIAPCEGMEMAVQAFSELNDSVATLEKLAIPVQTFLKTEFNLDVKSPFLAIHSFKEIQAIFILGQKLSEEAYTKEELSLFEIMLNQAITVFERITQAKKIIQTSKETEQLNAQLQEANQKLEISLAAETEIKEKALRVAKELSHQAMMSILMAGVSHEIRNPMSEILTMMYCLAEELGGRLDADYVGGTEGEAENEPTPWVYEIAREDYERVLGAERGAKAVAALSEAGYLNETLEITDKIDEDTLDVSGLDLGPEWANDLPSVKYVLGKQVRLKSAYEFFNMAQVQFRRILDVVENMMKYGVSGGVRKETFSKIEGISPEESVEIFNEMVAQGYLDEWGGVLEKYRHRKEGERLVVSPKYESLAFAIERQIDAAPGAIKERVALNGVVVSAASVLRGSLHKKGIELTLDVPDEPLMVSGDKLRLQQAVFNVIFNAIQALEKLSRPKKIIQVKIMRCRFMSQKGIVIPGVRVLIEDNGPGISDETMENIFNPFFSTKAPTGGKNAGLGLSIVRDVIMSHGGFVGVDSTVDEGTIFILTVPEWL